MNGSFQQLHDGEPLCLISLNTKTLWRHYSISVLHNYLTILVPFLVIRCVKFSILQVLLLDSLSSISYAIWRTLDHGLFVAPPPTTHSLVLLMRIGLVVWMITKAQVATIYSWKQSHFLVIFATTKSLSNKRKISVQRPNKCSC